MPVLGDIAVEGGLVLDDGHEALLGVLLLDQVLAGLAGDLAGQEDPQSRTERADLQRVLRSEQLDLDPQSRADISPGGAGFDQHRGALLVAQCQRPAGEVFGRPGGVVDHVAHRLAQLADIARLGPFQRRYGAGG